MLDRFGSAGLHRAHLADMTSLRMQACGTKADIWAFGTILWEICTGEQLVTRRQQYGGMNALPAEVLGMIGQCHQAEPAARPTASALKHQLLPLVGTPI